MKKKYDLRKIKARRAYTFADIADCLSVHIRTVQDWHKSGLEIIEGSKHPYRVLGSKIKAFLAKPILKLKENEFYCMKCKKPVEAKEVSKFFLNKKYNNGKEAIRFEGKCIFCGCKVSRCASENHQSNKSVI